MIKKFDNFKLNESKSTDNKIGLFIVDALNLGFINDIKKEDKSKTTYETDYIIYRFKINNSFIEVINIDEKGVFVYVDDNKLNISSKNAILIGDICKKKCE